ncbi:MAG: 50S ribosomal protein L17 [Desulfobacterales bacterium]|nr:MAG: 50S ribosomal protein L17 [Desulfobacterales bacterium]UCD89359.1 MAG: 50S ribosomal protein L17 [Desulfobacterales bacterium]
MRHRRARLKLNRTSSHRKAMFRNMVTSLFKHERIRTTDVKAKELRRWADNLITLAKRGDLHARRKALSIIREKDVVYKLFDEASEKYGAVSSGYTRIIKLGRRSGDAAPISMVELISKEESKKKKKTKKKKKVKAPVEEKKVAEKKREKVDKEEVKTEEKMGTLEPEATAQDLKVTPEVQDSTSDISKTTESDGTEAQEPESKREDTQSET